jgi:hypothetical protein
MQFRMGINLCDDIPEEDRKIEDGANIFARFESFANLDGYTPDEFFSKAKEAAQRALESDLEYLPNKV